MNSYAERAFFVLRYKPMLVMSSLTKIFSSFESQRNEMFSVCSAAQITQLLEQQVAAMSPNTAAIISMSLWEEKSVADISRELDINYKTTENNLLRARKQLRSYLDRILA